MTRRRRGEGDTDADTESQATSSIHGAPSRSFPHPLVRLPSRPHAVSPPSTSIRGAVVDPRLVAAVVVDPGRDADVIVEFQGARRSRAPARRTRRSAARCTAGQSQCQDGPRPRRWHPTRRQGSVSFAAPSVYSASFHGLAPLALADDSYQSFPSVGHSHAGAAHHRSDSRPISQRR